MKISVIVPVYNVENYLERNIKSLFALEADGIEFIYINDGSTDGSGSILHEYEKRDSRMIVVEQEHRGLGAARNRGLGMAKGEWILFVDSDDWLCKAQAERFLREREDACDVIWGACLNEAKSGKKQLFPHEKSSVTKSGIEWLNSGAVDYSVCVYLYKRSFLLQNRIRFPDGLLHEDMEFTPKVFTFAGKIKKTDIVFYRKVLRTGSITATSDVKRSMDLIRIADRLNLFYGKSKNAFVNNYLAFLCTQAIHLAILADIAVEEIFRGDEKRKRRTVYYLKNSSRIRDKLLACFLKLDLCKCYRKIYLLYHSVRNIF